MKANISNLAICLMAGSVVISAAPVSADEGDPVSLNTGGYVTTLGSYTKFLGNDALSHGLGGEFGAGIRHDFYAIEARGFYTVSSSTGTFGSGKLYGGSLSGLVFPTRIHAHHDYNSGSYLSRMMDNAYVIIGGGGQDLRHYANSGNYSFGTAFAQGGFGEILPLHFNRYEFGIRIEALYQAGSRSEDPKLVAENAPDNIDGPRHLNNLVISIGLHFPMGLPARPSAEAPPEPGAAVVPVDSTAQPPAPPMAPASSGQPAPGVNSNAPAPSSNETAPLAPSDAAPATGPAPPPPPPTQPSSNSSDLDQILNGPK